MGWLFAVALGLHRQSRQVVFVSLAADRARPCALDRGLWQACWSPPAPRARTTWCGSVRGLVAARLGRLPLALRPSPPRARRHADGAAGPRLWSFLMATAHGAGLMLWPVADAAMPSGTPAAGGVGRACWRRRSPVSASTRWRCWRVTAVVAVARLRMGRRRVPAARLAQPRSDLDRCAGRDGCAAAPRSSPVAQWSRQG